MKRKRVIRNVVRGLIIGLSSNLIYLLVVFLIVFFDSQILKFSSLQEYKLTPITGQPVEVTQDEYDESISTIDKFIFESPVYFFPKTISSENSFFLFYESIPDTSVPASRYELYLLCKWTEEEFNNEKTRLMCTAPQSRYDSLIYSENLFPLPAFVYLYNNFFTEFRYVLLDEINYEIRYISFREIGNKNNFVFDLKYVPQKSLYQATYIYVNTDDKCDCS